jgi:hypothetical protein
MAKHQRKVQAAVDHKIAETPVSTGKFKFHKPGTQNRKKAWDKAPKNN